MVSVCTVRTRLLMFRSPFFIAKHSYLLWIALLPVKLTLKISLYWNIVIYNVVLLFAVQEIESVIHIPTLL